MSWGLFPMRGEKGQSRSWIRSRRSTSDHPRMGVERTQSSRTAVRLNCGASTMEYRSRPVTLFRNTVVVSPALTMRAVLFSDRTAWKDGRAREAPGPGAAITRAAQRSISLPVSALQTALIVLRTASSDRPATPALSTRSSIERTPFTRPA